MKAWHFVGKTLRDGRPVPEDGEVLRHDGPLVLCRSGLHASRRLIEALWWAPRSTACRVEVGGEIIEGENEDKLVCRERTILWRVDATEALERLGRHAALEVAPLWDAPREVTRYLAEGGEGHRKAAMRAFRHNQGATHDRGHGSRWLARHAAKMACCPLSGTSMAWATWMTAWDATRAERLHVEGEEGPADGVLAHHAAIAGQDQYLTEAILQIHQGEGA